MYQKIARYYDLVHADLTADIGLILTLANAHPDPILELGCGTGRLLIPMARAGHRVIGVDNSAAMLAIARHKIAAEPTVVQNRITLVEANMVSDMPTGQFGLIILPYNTAMHLALAELTAVLRQTTTRLSPQGQLFIDLTNPFLIAQTPNDHLLTLERTFTDPETGQLVVQMASNRLDSDQQILTITWLYDTTPIPNGPLHRVVSTGTYHYQYPHQLEIQVQDSGLHLDHVYGDYRQSSFTEESDRLLLVASL